MAPSKNRMIKPFVSVRTASWEQTISLYIKKTFYIVYREEKSFGLCSHRLFPFLFPYPNRPLSAMYGLYCPPGIQQFFLLDKGKGTRKLSASQRGGGESRGGMCPPCCRACKAAGKNAGSSTARAGAKRSERGKCGNHAPGSRGTAPGTPLVTFVVKRKSPGARGGAPASVGAGTAVPQKTPPGAGRSARIGGCRGYQSRTSPSGEAERKKGVARGPRRGCRPRIKKTSCLLPQNIV